MTVSEAIQILSHYKPYAKVVAMVDGWDLPINGHTTYGGNNPHTVLFFVDTKLRLRVCTEEEAIKLDEMQPRES